MDKTFDRNRFKGIWRQDRVISRLIAAWVSYVIFMLIREGDWKELAFGQSYSILIAAAWTAAGFILLNLLALAGYPWHTDSWVLMAGATVCVCVWLNDPPQGDSKWLFWLAVTVAYALFAVWFAHVNRDMFRRIQPGKRTVVTVAVLGALISCTVIAVITCLRYKTFSSPNFDFGLFVNMFHNMRKTGLPMATSERNRLLSHFAVHISPVYYLLLPFYWLFPSPLTLQIGQAVVLMLGIIPVVLLAKHFKLSGWATAVVSLLYAFYPALSTGCFYDIHENCFLPLFLLLTFWFFESKHPIPMYISAVCVLSVKEDAAIYLIIFALYVLLSRKNYLHGILLGLLACGWFAISARLLELYGEGMMVNRFDNLIYDKNAGLLGAVQTALTNPGYLLTQLFTTSGGTWEKPVYFLELFLPLGLLPFCTRKPSRWLLLVPVLMNLLTYYTYQYNLGFQYHFGIAAFLVYATIQNLPDLSAAWRRALLGVAVASCLCLYVMSVLPNFSGYIDRWENGKARYRYMEELLDTVPEDASVNCSTFLLAHIADRNEIYEIQYHGYKPDVDYVVIDARYQGWEKPENAYLAQGYVIAVEEPGYVVILQRGES